MMVHTCNPSSQEVKEKGQEFKAILNKREY